MPPSGGQRGEAPRGHKPIFSAFLPPLYTETEEGGKKTIGNKRLRLTLLVYIPYVMGYRPTIPWGAGMDKREIKQDAKENVYDASTGEVYDKAVLAVFFPKRKNGFREGWFAMAQEALMTLARSNLSGQTMRVLFAVLSKVDFENFILISQSEIAKDLSIDKGDVSKSITKLIDIKVLIKGPKVGRSATYRLNPEFGWKGSASNHKEALMEQMKGRGLSVLEGGKGKAIGGKTETPD